MCTAPKTPQAPTPVAAPQAAKSPIAVPTRRKQNGAAGTAGYVGTGSFAEQSLLGTAPTPFNPIKKQTGGLQKALLGSVTGMFGVS